MIKAVIFDFDGVIADSGEIFAESLQEALKLPRPFSQKEVETLRNSSTREIVKTLGVRKWQLPGVLKRGKSGIAARMHRVEVFKDMPEAVKALHESGYKMFILSSNSKQAIDKILNDYKLESYISATYCNVGLFKTRRLKALMRKENLTKEQSVYVGDETRDIEAAKRIGIKCLAVEWGYNAPAALRLHNPNAMVSSPLKLKSVISSL